MHEDGLQVPLNSEVSENTAAWLQNGRNALGTIVNRVSMFDLHRTQVKKLRITSHKEQLYKGLLDVWKAVQREIAPGGNFESFTENDPRIAKLMEKLNDQETLMIGLKQVMLDDAKTEVALHLMTTLVLRDGVLCGTKYKEHVARQIRFQDTYSARLMMDPGLVAVYHVDDPPPKSDETHKPIPRTARKIRKKIVDELGNDFAGNPPPDLPRMPGPPRDAAQAYQLNSQVSISAASPGSGGALKPVISTRSRLFMPLHTP